MSVHPDPELLAAVALGDHPHQDLESHLASCPACAAELSSLRRLTAGLSDVEPVDWLEPPDGLWASIEREGAGGGADEAVPTPLRPVDRRAGWLPLALAGAAAVGVIAGALGGRAWWPVEPTAPVVVATTDLATLDDQRVLGEASLLRSRGGVELAVRTEPLDPGDGFLEVWLINTDGVRMVSIGVLADATDGLFPVSEALLGQGYRIVDVSRELFDDQPTHSGHSIVRGELVL